MSLILSGTDGLSDVDGSAATPAIRGTDANTGIFFPAADTIAFSEGGVESMRITPDGNVGIGVTPSATWSSSARAIQLGGFNSIFGYTSNVFRLANNAIFTAANETYGASSIGATYYQQYNGAHSWYNAASGTAGNAISFTQAMTLDANGRLFVNTTTEPGSNDSAVVIKAGGTSKSRCLSLEAVVGTSVIIQTFRNTNGQVGYIETVGSATAYVTSSDYRLKESIQPMIGALAKVALLKPVTYKWKVDGSDGQGFIAHELQALVPECVSGEKDAVNEDGTPKYQGIDTSFLVATLTAAIQELKAIVDAQAVEIAALKGTA